jgi:hypothetical protein
MFVDFLAIPKKIEKNIFENKVINQINDTDNKNLVKSSYELDVAKMFYQFKIENGREKSNLKRFFEIFTSIGFTTTDNFRNDTRILLHKLYNIGNLYAHSKSSTKTPKEDATNALNMLTHILSDIYGMKSDIIGKTIKSGYTDFPDICLGMSYAIELSATLEGAGRIYYNIPHKKYFDKLMRCVGTWNGEWRNKNGEVVKGVLTFSLKTKEHIIANLKYTRNSEKVTEQMEIKLFDNYIHLIGFDDNNMLHKKGKHIFFELEFFNENLLIGESIEHKGKVLFEKNKKTTNRQQAV